MGNMLIKAGTRTILLTVVTLGTILILIGTAAATSVTNNNAPSAVVVPGETVLVMNFTLVDGGDVLLNGTEPPAGAGTTTEPTGWQIAFYDADPNDGDYN